MKTKIVNLSKKIVPYKLRIALRKLNWRRYYLQQTLFGTQKNAPKVYCPIAEKEFKKFISLHNDLLTPTNGARSRHRLICLFLKNETDIFKAERKVLHIAPEYCLYQKFIATESCKYYPGDKMADGYGKQVGVNNVDLTDLPYDDFFFDYVLCNHVLEHIPDDRKAMAEIYRVLQPSGEAVITIPIDEAIGKTYEDETITSPEQRKKHFGQWDHLRLYSTDIKERLESIGFEVELIRYGDRFSREDYAKYGLCNNLIIHAKRAALPKNDNN